MPENVSSVESCSSGNSFQGRSQQDLPSASSSDNFFGCDSQSFNDAKCLSKSRKSIDTNNSLPTNDGRNAEPESIWKTFNDPIHGNMQFHPACVAIIDTPQFQRLRYLKQLSLVYFVYPGAAHNRFEHCLGVCYLAGKFVRHLRETQKNLGITDADQLCLEIAGLCHDLGHGPYSHLYDGPFMSKVEPGSKWKHEMGSVKMLDHVIKEKKLMEEDGILKRHGLKSQDITFIKELIAGPQSKSPDPEWPYEGREPEKAYLYEIIANNRNGVDVDKWDYIARDCLQLGIPNNFDYRSFLTFARVVEAEDVIPGLQKKVMRRQICITDKGVVNLCNMFATRYQLHKLAYKHEVHGALEIMMTQVLIKANDHIKIRGENGRMCKMSECIGDTVAFTKLTDNVTFKILDFEGDETNEKQVNDMKQAQGILKRIFSRDLFRCVYRTSPLKPEQLTERKCDSEKVKQKILEKAWEDKDLKKDDITHNSFYVQIATLDYGMKHLNPLERMNIYSKTDMNKAMPFKSDEISRILAPCNFNELVIRIYIAEQQSKFDYKYKEWFESTDILKKASPREE